MSTTTAISKGYEGGTLEQLSELTIDRDKQYIIFDYPIGGITNAYMAAALTEAQKGFYQVGSVYMCTDSGTYTARHFYKFTGYSWEEVSTEIKIDDVTIKKNSNGEIYAFAITDGNGNTYTYSALTNALAGKQATITGGATTITSSNLSSNYALISNSSGKVAVSSVTSTQLGYLSGVTSAVQTQFNNITDKIPSAASSSNQLADKSYVGTELTNRVVATIHRD